MLKNYLLVAFRNIKRHKVYSIVNITGLAIGMSAFILIALLLNYENNWDAQHNDGDRIYRVQALVEYDNDTQEWTQTTFPIAEELRTKYPEFEQVTVAREIWGELISRDREKVIHEQDGYYIEPQFFDIFNVNFLQGNPATALENENSVVITNELAERHFPNEDPMGKTIIGGVNGNLIVSAVVEKWPEQSHFRPSYLTGFSGLKRRYPDWRFRENWDSWSCRTYAKLKPSTDPAIVNNKIRNLLDDKLEENYKRLYLRPLNKLHLAARVEDEYNSPLPFYNIIAWFVLILACINYINLTTAKSTQREKEIGIRKVVGGSRFLLFKQFIGESLIVTFLALILSFFIAELLLPTFNSFMQRNLSIDYFKNIEFMAFIIGVMFTVGILSGIYPALYLSSFDPIKVIKGFTSFSKGSGSKGIIRKLLVGFQFTISLSLITLTYYVYNHVNYMKSIDLGFEEKNLLRIEVPSNDSPKMFKDLHTRLLTNSSVVNACINRHPPFFSSSGWDINWEGGKPEEKMNSRTNRVGHNFIDTYNMKIVTGRNFSEDHSTDEKNVLVNETFVRKAGWTNPIGKFIIDNEYTVIGVVKDFHNNSVHNLIQPYFMQLHSDKLSDAHNIVIRINEYNKAKTVDDINVILKEYFPSSLFQIVHYSDELDYGTYAVWEGVQATFGYFTFITIFIALIGIIGLLSFSVERKTKEIGIRKVLGASIQGLYMLINKDFFFIFIVALIISIPLGIMVIGITPGAYKYQMQIFDYALPIVTVGILSLAATAFISVRAALANPVDSLRSE